MTMAMLIGVVFIAVGAYFATQNPVEAPTITTPTASTEHPLIVAEFPKPEEVITSPLTVTGKARGPWYFEASFPVALVDWSGRIIVETHAEARGDWMTEKFVPFISTVEFEVPEGGEAFGWRGTLILMKDNPSGLPEHDDSIEIPIVFKH